MNKCTLDDWIVNKTGCDNTASLQQWQLARIREVVAMAKSRSPFYGSLYRDVNPDELRSIADLSRFPLTSARELAKNPYSWSCCSASQIDRIVTLKTSGTTATPKRVFFTVADQELTVDFFAHGMAGLTKAPGPTAILMPCQQEGGIGRLLAKGLSLIGVDSIPKGPVVDIAETYARIREANCDCIVGIPVQVLGLARYGATLAPEERVKLRTVLVSADTTPTSLVRELERLFECNVFTHFGMTETGFGGAVECEAHHGCHIREADMFVEIIDPATGLPVMDGEIGEIVFTTLTREAMPFIRYRTGDWGRLLSGRCDCQSFLRRLLPEGGRISEDIVLPDGGRPVSLLWMLDELLLGCENVVDIRTTLVGNHLHIVLQGVVVPDLEDARNRLYASDMLGGMLKSNVLEVTLEGERITGFSGNGMQKRLINCGV